MPTPEPAPVPPRPSRARWGVAAAVAVLALGAGGVVAFTLLGDTSDTTEPADTKTRSKRKGKTKKIFVPATGTYAHADANIRDAIQRNKGHAVFFEVNVFDDQVSVSLQQADKSGAVLRYFYKDGKFLWVRPRELTKNWEMDPKRLFTEKDYDIRQLGSLLADVKKRDPDDKVIDFELRREYQGKGHVVFIVMMYDDGIYHYWGDGRFRCDTSDKCPEDP